MGSLFFEGTVSASSDGVIVFALSDDMIVEILSKLPVESLLRFRCVSTTWWHLISEIFLAHKLFLSTSGFIFQRFAISERSNQIYVAKRRCFPLPGNSNNTCPGLELSPPFSQDHHITDVCNGLLLCYLHCNESTKLAVCNPATKQSIQLPPASSRGRTIHAGIDFDPQISTHYRVVQMVEDCSGSRSGPTLFELFPSETSTWHEVNVNLPEETETAGIRRFVFINGLVFVDLGCCSRKFLKLDLEDESCQSLKLPALWPRPLVGALGKCMGHLHYAWLHYSDLRICRIDVVDGEFEWTLLHAQKRFSLKYEVILNFLPDSETLLMGTNNNIYSYNFTTQKFPGNL